MFDALDNEALLAAYTQHKQDEEKALELYRRSTDKGAHRLAELRLKEMRQATEQANKLKAMILERMQEL